MLDNQFVNLVKLANQAKAFGEYRIANFIFAYLLDQYFNFTVEEFLGDDNAPPKAWLKWETQDEVGEYPSELYYDLLVIEAPETLENGYVLHRLNIPVPLLDQRSAMTALKSAQIVERAEHGREISDATDSEVADLWQQLFDLVDKSDLSSAVQAHLDFEESGLPLVPINWGENGGDGSVNLDEFLEEPVYAD